MAINLGLVPSGMAGYEAGLNLGERMRRTALDIEAAQRQELGRIAALNERQAAMGAAIPGLTPEAGGLGLTMPPTAGAADGRSVYPIPGAAPAAGQPQAGVTPPATGAAPAAGQPQAGAQPSAGFGAAVVPQGEQGLGRTYAGATLGQDISSANTFIQSALRAPLGVRMRVTSQTGPEQAQQRAKDEAAAWFASPRGQQYFMQNPDDLEAAKADPLGFFQNTVKAVGADKAPAAPRAAAPAPAPAAAGTPTAPTPAPAAAPAAAAAPRAAALPPQIDALTVSTANRYGISPDAMRRLVQIESGGNPMAQNGNAMGLLQFVPDTAKQFGLTNPFDPAASLDAGARLWVANKQFLTNSLGRVPTDGELYLAHQQGAAGARALLSNPNQNVVTALAGAYGGDQQRALRAVMGNGGNPNMTAGQFASVWTSKFGGGGGPEVAPGLPADIRQIVQSRTQFTDQFQRQQQIEFQRANAIISGLQRQQQLLEADARAALSVGDVAGHRTAMQQLTEMNKQVAMADADYRANANLATAQARAAILKQDADLVNRVAEIAVSELDTGRVQRMEALWSDATGEPIKIEGVEGGYRIYQNGRPIGDKTLTREQLTKRFLETSSVTYRQRISEAAAQERAADLDIKKTLAGKLADLKIEEFKQASETQRATILKTMEPDVRLTPDGKAVIVRGGVVYTVDENRAKVGGLTPEAIKRVGTLDEVFGGQTPAPQAGLATR